MYVCMFFTLLCLSRHLSASVSFLFFFFHFLFPSFLVSTLVFSLALASCSCDTNNHSTIVVIFLVESGPALSPRTIDWCWTLLNPTSTGHPRPSSLSSWLSDSKVAVTNNLETNTKTSGHKWRGGVGWGWGLLSKKYNKKRLNLKLYRSLFLIVFILW